MKILVIWNRIGDYHRARLRALGGQIGFDNLVAADFGASDGLYQWENSANTPYEHRFLSQKHVNQKDIITRVRNYQNLLRQYHVEVVCIPGYGKLEYILFILLAKLMRKKVILFAESWYGNNSFVNFVKGTFLKLFVNGFFVSGSRAEGHFHQKLKIPLTKIARGYSVIDNNHFIPSNESPKLYQPTLLCVARYSTEKNLHNLIKAYQQSKLHRKWQLVLVGDGPQRSALEELAVDDKEWISLERWKTYKELPRLYTTADAFILPSVFEPWGLVVNEAMATGLPVFVSEECGCAPELVTEQNGFVFEKTQDTDQLIEVLNAIGVYTPEELIQMGKYSEVLIEKLTVDAWAKNLLGLVN